MGGALSLDVAAAEAKLARERLIATGRELQSRLDPLALIEDAREGVRDRAVELAETVGDAARSRPGVAAGIGAGAALLLLRRPLRRLFGRRRETERPKHR